MINTIRRIRLSLLIIVFSFINHQPVLAHSKDGINTWQIPYSIKNILVNIGLILFIVSITFFITKIVNNKNNEIKRIYKRLKEKEKNYYGIFNNSPLAIIMMDNNLNFKEWNKASENMFGWTKEEVISKQNIDLILPDQLKQNFIKNMGGIHRIPTNVINKNITKNGEIIVCEWNNTIITDNANNITEIISIAQNITERIKTENQLLEQRKTLKAYSEQLEIQIEKLEETNEQVFELSNRLEKIIELTDSLYESTLKDENEFLSNLLHTASLLIPQADYGSVYTYKNGMVKFIDTIGHDLKILQNLQINSEVFFKSSDEIITIKNVVDFTADKIDEKIRQDFINASKPIRETLKFDLFINKELIAGISLDIGVDNSNTFDENSKKVMKSFRNFTNAFYTMQRYSKLQADFQKEIIFSFIQVLEIHDNYTKNHSQNVAHWSYKIAESLNLSKEEINNAYWAGLVHDIGKILIPANILNKKEKLLNSEFEHIKKHPYWGYITLNHTKHLKDIAKYVLYHHEHWDGSGYPSNLKEDEIPLISQIITLADSWDAMSSNRSYRSKLPKEIALKEIINKKGTHFSPKVVDAFLAVINVEKETDKVDVV